MAVAPRRRSRDGRYDELVESTLDRLAKHLATSSISTACSAWRDNGERQRRDQRDQDRVGAAVELERSPDVLRVGVAAAVAHRRIIDHHAAVDPRPASESPSAPAIAASGQPAFGER